MIKIGIISPSNIAFKRFLPALKTIKDFDYVGVAIASPEEWDSDCKNINDIINNELQKAKHFVNEFGGRIFKSYRQMILSKDIDAVYIPLPPSLHYKWTKISLENNKHVLVEKPSTTQLVNTIEIIGLAKKHSLALHENYMFQYHAQIAEIQELINSDELGDTRLYRMSFGFPYRGKNDFRYDKALGGGALLDCGGYPIKLANILLGESSRITASKLNYLSQHNVDMFGSATLTNDEGVTAQISFGMDNFYRCELEIWGTKALLRTNRIFTAPADVIPEIEIFNFDGIIKRYLKKDDAFKNSILHFMKCIFESEIRHKTYNEIQLQAESIEKINMEVEDGN